jgi:hypothetical protein
MKRPGSDGPTPTATSTAMTGTHLVPVCRTVPSRRMAFGGAVLFIALGLVVVLLRHWQRRNEEAESKFACPNLAIIPQGHRPDPRRRHLRESCDAGATPPIGSLSPRVAVH